MISEALLFPFAVDRSWYERYWLAADGQPSGCPHPLRCGAGRLGRRIAWLLPATAEKPVPAPPWAVAPMAQRRALS